MWAAWTCSAMSCNPRALEAPEGSPPTLLTFDLGPRGCFTCDREAAPPRLCLDSRCAEAAKARHGVMHAVQGGEEKLTNLNLTSGQTPAGWKRFSSMA